MDVESLERSIHEDIEKAASVEALEAARIRYLGRKGQITSLLRNIKDVPPEERPNLGAVANRLKQLAERLLEGKTLALRRTSAKSRFYRAPRDATLPASDGLTGHRHSKIRKHHQVGTVFLYRGKPIQRINKAWTDAVRRAGIPHITVHQGMRHTFGTRLARAGVPVNEIQELMGHTNIKTTQRYLHSNERRGREAVAVLD